MSLTREQIERLRPPTGYIWTRSQELQNTLCDMAEAYRALSEQPSEQRRPEDDFQTGDPHPCDMTAQEREKLFAHPPSPRPSEPTLETVMREIAAGGAPTHSDHPLQHWDHTCAACQWEEAVATLPASPPSPQPQGAERIYTKADMEAACELVRAASRKADQIALGRLVDRFLNWKLPDSVCSDPCATQRGYPHRIGTNLLTADEAKQMLEHVLSRHPDIAPDTHPLRAEGDRDRIIEELLGEPRQVEAVREIERITPARGLSSTIKMGELQDALCSTRSSPKPEIERGEREGWISVPIELTPGMHEAGLRFAGALHANYEDCWKAMLSAATKDSHE